MAIAIFGAQFTALWAALLALGSTVLVLRALARREWLLLAASGLTFAALIYVAIRTLPNLAV